VGNSASPLLGNTDLPLTTTGPTVWVQPSTTGSTLAQQTASTNLGKAICGRIYELRFGSYNDCSSRVFTSDLAVLREANNTLPPNGLAFPVVLIEVANLASGSADRTWLGTGSTQDTQLNLIGDAMYNGIIDWYTTYNETARPLLKRERPSCRSVIPTTKCAKSYKSPRAFIIFKPY
jgi:hypothetical protein